MSKSWDGALKRLQELQKRIPEPLLIELTYQDGAVEELTLDEVLQRDNSSWKKFRVVKGTNLKEVEELLKWIIPEGSVI